MQYLAPLVGGFANAGASVRVTARDNGATFDLLQQRGLPFVRVGRDFGASKASKALGLLRRTRGLLAEARRNETSNALVSSSRPSALAARLLGIPSFILCDYEFVDLQTYRRFGSYLLFPDVIKAATFERLGFSLERLIPFRGLKENLSFAGVDLDAIPPYDFAAIRDGSLVRVLFRPPAERSHYYESRTGALSFELLTHLAASEQVVVVLSPRYSSQIRQLDGLAWRNQPVVLTKPVAFIPLLKAVDAVVSAGGTMLREAAFLGVPAYSTLQGRRGAVDRFLASLGRLRFIGTHDDFDGLELRKREHASPLATNHSVLDEIVEAVGSRIPQHRPARVSSA